MAIRKLPDLTADRVVELQDALLANAHALLTSALAVLDLGQVALARSLAILGLEESGKAVAVHERRVEMTSAPEGEPFRCAWLDELWASHQIRGILARGTPELVIAALSVRTPRREPHQSLS